MLRAALLQVDPETAAAIARFAPERGLALEWLADPEAALERVRQASPPLDALVIGPTVPAPIALAQQARAIDRDLALLILAAPDDLAPTRRALQFAPNVGVNVRCHSTAALATLTADLLVGAEQARAGRSHRIALAAATQRLAAAAPPPRAGSYLGQLLEHAPIGAVLVDAGGRVLGLNRRARFLLERSADETLGLSLTDLFPTQAEAALRLLGQAETGAQVAPAAEPVTLALTPAAGGVRFLELTAASLIGLTGESGALILLKDITDRTLAARVLAEQARLAAFEREVALALGQASTLREMLQRCAEAMVHHLDAAFARIWTLDAAEQVLELQASAGQYTHLDGAHARIAVGQYKIGLIAAERRPHLTNRVLDDPRISDPEWARREGMVAFAGYPLLLGDRLVGVLALFARHPLAEGTLEALGSIADQVALGIERKRAEEQRDALARERAAILDHLAEGVIVADRTGRITYANEAARRLHGVAALGVPVAEYSSAYHLSTLEGQPYPPEELPLARAALQGETVVGAHWRVRRPDGSTVIAEGSAAPVYREDGERIGAVLVLRDVTAAHELDRQKEEFLASASHDLKNPLAAIKGTVQLLRRRLERTGEPPDPERLAAALQSIETSVNQMTAQAGRLLDIAGLRMGRPLELERAQTDLIELARRAVARHQATTEHHELRLEAAEPTLVGLWDPLRLERVLDNLLSNAIKYSPRGGSVVVAVAREPGAAGELAGSPSDPAVARGALAVLSVTDQGIGIPAADQPHIFQRFHRAANVVGRIEGTGIGLADVAQVVREHGGAVTLTSQEGVGTCITVRLPLRPPDPPGEPAG